MSKLFPAVSVPLYFSAGLPYVDWKVPFNMIQNFFGWVIELKFQPFGIVILFDPFSNFYFVNFESFANAGNSPR